MKLVLGLALLLSSCSALPSSAYQSPPSAEPVQRISIYLGQRNLDEGDYAPVDEQFMFGVEYSNETPGNAIGWEVGIMGSEDDGTVGGLGDVTGSTGEIYGGVRKTFGEGVVRPYIGGGLSFINAEVEASGFGSEDDSSFALYLHGGVLFDVSQTFFLGLDLRALFGSSIEFGTFEGDADYGQLALILGFRF